MIGDPRGRRELPATHPVDPPHDGRPHSIVTIDAENRTTLREGIRIISSLRDEVERSQGTDIPLVWFVKFQRTWDEYLGIDSPAYFEEPVEECFDGFAIAKAELLEMRDRGDEIGWHYHATGFVHRDDLARETRVEILNADLVSCGRALRERHPEFDVRGFRFGWFFVPDYSVFRSLSRAGILVDASVHPGRTEGMQVARHSATYLAPVTDRPCLLDGVCLVPFVDTLLIHDWNVVPHEVSWRSYDAVAAEDRKAKFVASLTRLARVLADSRGSFVTFEGYRHYAGNGGSPPSPAPARGG